MRILHWTESFWPRIGGAEIFSRLLATESCRHGHECLVVSDVANQLPAEDEVDGVRVRRFPLQATLAARDLPAIMLLVGDVTGAVRAFAPDVVHLHTSQPGAFFYLRMQKSTRVPAIFTTHDPLALTGSANPLLVELLATTAAIAGISTFMVDAVRHAFPDVATRVRHVPHGLPEPSVAPSPPSWDPPIVAASGRLTDPKGFDVLLKALPTIRGAVPSVALVIAGDGPCRVSLEALARDLNVDECVEFAGWLNRDGIARVIDRAAVVAVPSRWQEPFGLVALEAMQRARPVVASRAGGLPDAVRHGRTGLLVPPDDPDALAEALVALLADRARATRMGEEGRSYASEAFSWTRCADAYHALYLEVAG